MQFYYKVIRKILFLLPPESAHKVTLNFLYFLNKLNLLDLIFKNKYKSSKLHTKLNLNQGSISFNNRLGLAAGLDKNADFLEPLSKLGFGFIEVGTVTPRAQAGNNKPRLFRLIKNKAIINRMGFNNNGVDYLVNNVIKFKQNNNNSIVGINIGKNFDTKLEDAINDYLICMEKAYNYCDYISVNISSPNTVGLRELQKPEYLDLLLLGLKQKQAELNVKYNKYTPIAIKISPDLTDTQIIELCSLIIKHKIDIIIATNTTVEHELLYDHNNNKIQGGLSGKPLFDKSNLVLKIIVDTLKANDVYNNIIVIGVGGIISKDDALYKLQLGAHLVQIYSGLIYEGPHLVDEILDGMSN